MDDDDDSDGFDADELLGRFNPQDYLPTVPIGQPPCPRPGVNGEFDRYFRETYGNDHSDPDELRRAVWATWRTEAPAPLPASTFNTTHHEDEEVARVMALSAEEYQAAGLHTQGSTSGTPIQLVDDDDENDMEYRRVLAQSEEEARAPRRPRRNETPEEERKMLAEALAASLADQQEPENEEEIWEDEDPEPIKKASNGPHHVQSRDTDNGSHPPHLDSKAQNPTPAPISQARPESSAAAPPAQPLKIGGMVIDRAKLERERLERQGARLGNSSTSTSTVTGSKAPLVSTASRSGSSLPPPTTAPSTTSHTRTDKGKQKEDIKSIPSTPLGHSHPFRAVRPLRDPAGEYFLEGELRHTALDIGEPTSDPVFSPQDVIGDKSQISLIIMSSFVLDDEWMSTIMPRPDVVPTIMIRPHPKEMTTWNGKVQAQANLEVRCYPYMVGEWGSAHMKFAWIFYKTGRLRVMIGTANMVPYDWEWIENTIFVQDFLQNPSSSTASLPRNHAGTDFQTQFRHLFIHLKVHKALKHLISTHPSASKIPFTQNKDFEDMAKWDFSKVKVRIVMSIPGSYTGFGQGGIDRFGLCRLGEIINGEGWVAAKGERVVVEYQGSSLGQYDINWFDTFYQYCTGKSSTSLSNRPKATLWPPMKVLFPSLATIDATILGRDGGGTMFCGKAWNKVTAPLFHDSNSKRGGVLMHAKMIVAIFEPLPQSLGFQPESPKNGKRKAEEIENENKYGGWIYTGSHNFSSAAWGTVNFKKNPPALSIRNYEMGIMFPLPRDGARIVADKVAPYMRPARKYGPDDQPWSQTLHARPSPGSG